MLLSALASFLSLSKIYFKPFSMGLSFLAKYSTALKFKHHVTEGFQRSPQEKETGQERSRWYHQVDFVERKSSTPAWAVVLHHSEFKQINIKGTHLALKWDLSLEIVAVQHRPWGLGHVYYTHVILSQLRFFLFPIEWLRAAGGKKREESWELQLLSLARELISAWISSPWLTALVGKLERTALKLDITLLCDFWSLVLSHPMEKKEAMCPLFKMPLSHKNEKGIITFTGVFVLQSLFNLSSNFQTGEKSEGIQRQNQWWNCTSIPGEGG